MAFCGIDFKDDKKDERGFNHRLKNKKAFSTVKKQFKPCSKEGLLYTDEDGELQDRRIKIEFDKEKPALLSFVSLCQMAADVNDSIEGLGSCTRIKVKDVWCILTCAHNLVSKSVVTGKFANHKTGYMYQTRQGEYAWAELWKLKMNKIRVHPKYNDDSTSGFDIAVCPVVREPHSFDGRVAYSKLIVDVEWSSADPKKIKVGYEIEVGGYPGEKDGHPHYHRGTVKVIKKTEEGGYLLFYDTDTTPGNSGSAIMIVDERFLNEDDKKNGIKKRVIGVHTGHSAFDNLNYGTLMTPELVKWMKEGI